MEELGQYIKSRRESGIADEIIKKELLGVGWDVNTINSCFPLVENIQNNLNPSVGVAGTLVVDESRNLNISDYGNKKSGKKGWLMVVVFLLVLLGGVLFGTYGVVYASWRLPGLSEEARRSLLLKVASIPSLPKTAEQILLLAVNNAQEMEKYDLDMSMSASLGGKSAEIGKVDLFLKGPIDITDVAKVQTDMELKLGVNWLGTLYSGGVLVKKPAEKKVYFQLLPFSDSIWNLATSYT